MISPVGSKNSKSVAGASADGCYWRAGRTARKVRRGFQFTLVDRQFRHRYMAANLMPRLCARQKRRFLRAADFSKLARAARVEDAAAGRMDGAGNLSLQPHAFRGLSIDRRDRRQQGFGIGVMRSRKDPLGRSDFHEASEIEDGDPVGHVPDHLDVVAAADQHIA